jgi:hypothetical protein
VASGVMAAAYLYEVWQQANADYEKSVKELKEFADLIAPLFPKGGVFWHDGGLVMIPAEPTNTEQNITGACNRKTNVPPGLEFEAQPFPQVSLTGNEQTRRDIISEISEILQKYLSPPQLNNAHAAPAPSRLKNEVASDQEPLNSDAEFSPYSLM